MLSVGAERRSRSMRLLLNLMALHRRHVAARENLKGLVVAVRGGVSRFKTMRAIVARSRFFVLLRPTGSLAHNPSETDGLFLCLLLAFIQPDVARNVSRNQSSVVKERLEERFSTLGFTSQLKADVCLLLRWWLENKMLYSPEQMDAAFRQLTIPRS